MDQGDVPEMSEMKSLDRMITGVLAQDLQLVKQVKRTSKFDENKLEHLSRWKIDGARSGDENDTNLIVIVLK